MTTQINNSVQVAESELAYLVLNYLEEKGWKKTAGSMKREAKDLLRAGSQRFAVGTIPKPLATIVSEYLQLTYKETQRTILQRNNPLAQSMYSLLDYTAAGGGAAAIGRIPANNNNTAVAPNNHGHMQQQVQMMYQQPHQQHPVVGVGGGAGGIVPIGSLGNTTATNNDHQGQQQRQPPLTPGGRHAQRKGAPKKRRRLDTDFDTAGGAGVFPFGHFPLSYDASMNGNMGASTIPHMHHYQHHNLDPLNNGECSLFGDDVSFDFFGAVDEKAMLEFGNMLADNINKTQEAQQQEYGLTDYILEDPESAGFLSKLVSAHPMQHPIVDPNFRIGAAATGTSAPSGVGVGDVATQERPTTRQSVQQQPTPMSPLGGSRLGKRKNTPTKRPTPVRSSGSGKVDQKSPAAAGAGKAEEKKGSEKKQAVADEIAEYLKKPDDFEDLINECVG